MLYRRSMSDGSIEFVLNQPASISVDGAMEAAEKLRVQHFSATTDAMFKRLFVQGINEDELKANRELLVCTVKSVIGHSLRGSLLGERCERLLEQRIGEPIELVQETLNDPQSNLNVSGSSANFQNKKGKLPDMPKVDFAAKVVLQGKGSEKDEHCVFGVEMQVRYDPKFPMFVRLPYYGNLLSRLCSEEDTQTGSKQKKMALETFAAAICMWDNDVGNLVKISGVERGNFCNPDKNSRGAVFYKEIAYPVCCAQIFLVKYVDVMSHLIAAINEQNIPHVSEIKVREKRAVNQFGEERQKRQTQLKEKFNKLYSRDGVVVDVDALRNKFKGLLGDVAYDIKNKTIGGLMEDDVPEEYKEEFKILEIYELLEFFSVGNVTIEGDINDEVISNTVRSLYMNTAITKDNVTNDPQQAGNIWFSERYFEDYKKIEEEKKVNAQATTVLGKLFGFPDPAHAGGFILPNKVLDEIVDKDLRGRVIQKVKESNSDIKMTKEGLEFLPRPVSKNR